LENVEYVVLMTDGVSKLVAPTELETILQEEKSPEAVISRVMDIVSNPQKVAGMIGRDVKKLANLDDATIIIIKSYKEG
jgi:serine/threonine protein phosphatase PrpC